MSLLAQLKILVVDDTTTSRMLLRDALENLGFRQIQVAADGEQALKMMMTAPCHIIISDYNMPEMDGLALLRAVRGHQTVRKLPFILLTGRGDRDLVVKAAQTGVNNYVVKPFTNAVLREKIEQVMGKLA